MIVMAMKNLQWTSLKIIEFYGLRGSVRLGELCEDRVNPDVVQILQLPDQLAAKATVTKEHGVPKHAVTSISLPL